jgi:flagellar biogenesis protein FliO
LFEEDRAERPKARKDKGSSARGWFLTGEEGTGPNLVGSAGMLFGLVVRLGVVLMLAYLGARSLRRLSLGRNAPSSGEGLVKVLETVALGANRWVHVVAVGEQTYLIGSTSQQTVMMAELRESGAVQELRARGERPGGLAGRLGGLFGGKRDSGFGSSLNAASSLLAEKLGELKSLGTTSRFTGGKA